MQARPRQHHERLRKECIWRLGGLYFFQGGTPFHRYIHRDYFTRSARANIIMHILEIRVLIAAATDLLDFF